MRISRAPLAALAVVALAAVGCGGSSSGGGAQAGATSSAGTQTQATSTLCPNGTGHGSVTIGAFDFSESRILAEMYADALKDCGYDATVRKVGNREVTEPALEQGSIDLVPEYVGTLTEFLNKKINGANAKPLASGDLTATKAALDRLAAQRGLVAYQPAQAADQNAFAVTQAFAQAHNLTTLSDLAAYSKDHPLVLGGPTECPTRPFCQPGLEQTYGMKFKNFVPLDAGGPLTKKAIQDGKVDVGLVFSSDGGLNQLKLKVLDDDKKLQTVDNIVPVVRKASSAAPMEQALNAVDAKLTTDELITLNQQVDLERKDPADVAKAFLVQQGLLKG